MRYPKQVYFEGTKNFYKRNYVKATEIITPKFYLETDRELAGEDISIIDEIINTHLNIASRYSDVITSSIGGITTVPDSGYSAINTVTGLSQFFVKQNNLTDIDANDLERKILLPLGYSLKNFETSSQFRQFLVSSLLPSIRLNTITSPEENPKFVSIDGEPLKDGTYNTISFNKHSYLITNLSWIYFLNVSGPSVHGWDIVADSLVETIWSGKNFMLNDALKCLTEYIFRNYQAKPDWEKYNLLPRYLKPNLNLNDTTYVSGTQQLDKLKTYIDIIYSPLYADRGDLRVKEAFDQFIENGFILDDLEVQGPFYKFLKAISFAFSDYNNSIELLEILNDVTRCPDNFLPYIADLLGWRLLGSEPQKWRVQLINCVSIYKQVGTKKALQTVVDSTFSQDLFNASSQIIDLWESYIPNLIHYTLATESSLFKDFSTWTRNQANELGVTYSLSSFDECIRCAVDKIILDVANKFLFKFWVEGNELSVSSPSCTFNYRGRDYSVPPFEEYPFYLNQSLTNEVINYLEEKLICFGVSESFAGQLSNYIKQNSTQSTNDVNLGYSWLFFTSSSQYPPNWDNILLDISNKKPEYLSLWNGKSSHFKIFLDVNSFRFIKDSLLINSIEGLRILNEIIDEFSPAHAVKQLYFRLYSDDFVKYNQTILPLIFVSKTDHAPLNESDTLGLSNYETSGNDIRSYKRGLTTNYNIISRSKSDSLTDECFSGVINAPRKGFRRRGFKNILDNEGVYTRNGFNMPTTFKMKVDENSYSSLGFLPLGLIPSSQSFVRVSGQVITPNLLNVTETFESWRNIPEIYSICQGLNSNSIFSGLVISSTFPCRGFRSDDLASPLGDYTVDRGQLNNILRMMHYIGENSKYVYISALLEQNPSISSNAPNYKKLIDSLVNQLTNQANSFPAAFSDYENFKFGKDIHKLHRIYCTHFERHPLTKQLINLDGPNILAHTFGSIYRNSRLTSFGSAYASNKDYVTSSLLNEYFIRPFGEFFPSAGGGVYNSFFLSSPDKFPLSTSDLASSSIIDGIEFIHSLTQTDNYFSVYNLKALEINYPFGSPDPYFKNKTILKIKTSNSEINSPTSRVRLDLKTYQNLDNPIQTNFLIPEHTFKIEINSLIANDDLRELGGGLFGIWIHTGYELSGTWVYTPKRKWEFIKSEDISISSVKNKYCHILTSPVTTKDVTITERLCRSNLISELSLYDLTESDFTKASITFDTKNQPIRVSNDYYKTYQQVHRKNQNYYIEIIPLQWSKSLYLQGINVIDTTLNKWSQPLVSSIGNYFPVGDFNKKQYRLQLDKEKIYYILKYFTEITGTQSQLGLASRIASVTQSKFEANGGSRLNYRISPDWLPNTKVDYGFDLINYLEIEN